MTEVMRHYDELLAEHYTWMTGLSLRDKAAEQLLPLEEIGVEKARGGLAVDLGCGPGFQSLALADLGYGPVLAVDTCEALLCELDTAKGGAAIETATADLRCIAQLVPDAAATIVVCMGDSLTHLSTRADVTNLFRDVHAALSVDGQFVLTFRDYAIARQGLDRFIPVQTDADRILLCALDYRPATVTVTDLVLSRVDGHWSLKKSSYQKLRLSPPEIASELEQIGFSIDHDAATGGMHALVARKPAA